MPISSMIAQVGNLSPVEVAETIDQYPNTNVTHIQNGSLIILTETNSKEQDMEIWDKIENTPGVLSLDLIYHNFERL